MSLQSQFMKFHEAILLKRFDENAELREKRERILKRLRDNLSVTFEPFNQGSYAMGTGIKPLDGDYDIDIGIILKDVYTDRDPVTVKGWVYDAVKNHTARVDWRRPCITVYYQDAGEVIYHVDLVVMVRDRYISNKLYLALGKQHSSADQREWQHDDRQGFMAAVDQKCQGEDGAQFRRVVRYLKRWKDVNFPKNGHAAPSGLSLTVGAYYSFTPNKTREYYTGRESYDDLSAVLAVASWLRSRFTQVWDSSSYAYVRAISLTFPFAPKDDVFAKMSRQQQEEFYQRLGQLISNLEQAKNSDSAGYLQKAFGKDFPLA